MDLLSADPAAAAAGAAAMKAAAAAKAAGVKVTKLAVNKAAAKTAANNAALKKLVTPPNTHTDNSHYTGNSHYTDYSHSAAGSHCGVTVGSNGVGGTCTIHPGGNPNVTVEPSAYYNNRYDHGWTVKVGAKW